jgi:hypothetical protein
MRNHEVTTIQPLLKSDGSLREPGWSRDLLQVYNRQHVKAPKFRIKEWDYYLVLNKDFAIALTISDDGYIGLQSASFIDFNTPWEHTKSILNPIPMGKFNLPSTSKIGDTIYHDMNLKMVFLVESDYRKLICEYKNFYHHETLACDITLSQPPMDTMVIATPWKENKNAFYFNQKINCMRASGTVNFKGTSYTFNPTTDFATLDWGRGVWTYDNSWYWSSGNCLLNGKPFGFNIGYGFGDTTSATENILFYDGKCHKLDDVTFHIPNDDYLKPWSFTSSDGRFEMDFNPIIDRFANTSAIIIETNQHQVFGKMNGKVILDDGQVLEIQDLLCFAEYVHNRY